MKEKFVYILCIQKIREKLNVKFFIGNSIILLIKLTFTDTTTTTSAVLWPFVRDYPGEPVREETFTHSYLS